MEKKDHIEELNTSDVDQDVELTIDHVVELGGNKV